MQEKTFTPYPVVQQLNIPCMYSFFQEHNDAGYAFPGEAHNFWECVCVLEGALCVTADDRVYEMDAGQIIFHKPLEFHKLHVTSPDGATLLIFSFDAEGPMTAQLENKVFLLGERHKDIIDALLLYVRSRMPYRKQTVQDLPFFLYPFEHLPTYSQTVVSYLYQLFFALVEDGSVSATSSAPDADIFRKAVRYLHSNLHRQPSIPEIAKHCSISDASLKRLFKKYAGVSTHQYILNLKINLASQLLQNQQNAAVVAQKLGFSNQSYFSRAYKRQTGLTPTQVSKSSKG